MEFPVGRRGACLECHAQRQRIRHAKKQAEKALQPTSDGQHDTSRALGEEKPAEGTQEALLSQLLNTSEATSAPLADFASRATLEEYLTRELPATLKQYDDLIDGYKAQRNLALAQRLVDEANRATNGIRQVLKDKQAFQLSLTKQFELLASLFRPLDEDPRFTPVVLHLNFEPPREAIIKPPFVLDEEDLQSNDPATS